MDASEQRPPADVAGPARLAVDAELLARAVESHLVPVHEPLLLVSQVQRSGGTLLSQLLDGHPELHAHPYELKLGSTSKEGWPALGPDGPAAAWLEQLHEADVERHLAEGYAKSSRLKLGHPGEVDRFAFLFLPELQRRLFVALAPAPGATPRAVLDAYFTSYFNAWLDCRGLRSRPKRYVSAFLPRLQMRPADLAAWSAAYPDGLLVTLVRDPADWYCSAREHNPKRYADVDAAQAVWTESAEASLAAVAALGSRARLVAYEQLAADTEATMQALATWAGIPFVPELLQPTFNGLPIRSNSTRPVTEHGVLQAPVGRSAAELDRATRDAILLRTGPLRERVAAALA